MKSDRGQYRAITVVLLDGPDFQKLPPEARWVFVALKISLGPCGIQVEYPAGLVEKLAGRTGYPQAIVADMLNVLQSTGWIRTDRNVVWVVKQLKFEPAMTPNNEKHRTAVVAHAKGLPTLAIVGEFIREYRAYFVDWEELAMRYPKPEEAEPIAYTIAPRITEDRRQKTEEVAFPTETAGAAPILNPHNQQSCMRLVVERLYLGRRPLDRDMATNGSLVRNFARQYGFDGVARIIEGLALRRDRGELYGVGATQAVGLKWLNSAKMDLNQLAVSEDAYYRGNGETPATRGKNGPEGIAGIVGRIGA